LVIVPRTTGVDVFTGGPTTTAVGFDAAVREPSAFIAVTRTRIREPTSALVSRYLSPVAPEMIVQLPPSGSPPSAPQRTHWNAYEIGLVPVHVPRAALSLTPCSARPLIAGSAVFDGGVACAATPWAAGRTSADSASAVTTAPLEVIDPSLVTPVMTCIASKRRDLLRTSYRALHLPYRVDYDARRRSGALS